MPYPSPRTAEETGLKSADTESFVVRIRHRKNLNEVYQKLYALKPRCWPVSAKTATDPNEVESGVFDTLRIDLESSATAASSIWYTLPAALILDLQVSFLTAKALTFRPVIELVIASSSEVGPKVLDLAIAGVRATTESTGTFGTLPGRRPPFNIFGNARRYVPSHKQCPGPPDKNMLSDTDILAP